MPKREVTEQLIAEVDARTPSPSARAASVWIVVQEAAPEATTWDLVCFCTEFLGSVLALYPWLEKPLKEMNNLVYIAHYIASNQSVSDVTGTIPRTEPESDSPRTLFESKPTAGSNTSTEESVHLRDSRGNTSQENSKTPTRNDGS